MNVELVSHTPHAEHLIASAYGICTDRDVPIENIPKWISMGHLSPVEHASATFEISGISRACSHQLVRHRLASYSQQSQRYVSWEGACKKVCDGAWETVADRFVKPPEMHPSIFEGAINEACAFYLDAIELDGCKPEDARFLLPNAAMTELMMTANFREWRHIIQLRTDPAAQWEIRELCEEIRGQLYYLAPYVFGDLYE